MENMNDDMSGKRFIVSFSNGKDSMLALYRAMNSGMIPIRLFTMRNTDAGKGSLHKLDDRVADAVSDSLGIPLIRLSASGPDYANTMETEMKKMKEAGAEVCVFGDIDLRGHFDWCTERCRNAGLEAFFPLWNESRRSLVYEFIDTGFKADIITVDRTRMETKHLGRTLNRERADEIEGYGTDICGENGEYHTFVHDGPIFRYPVKFLFGTQVISDNHILLPVLSHINEDDWLDESSKQL